MSLATQTNPTLDADRRVWYLSAGGVRSLGSVMNRKVVRLRSEEPLFLPSSLLLVMPAPLAMPLLLVVRMPPKSEKRKPCQRPCINRLYPQMLGIISESLVRKAKLTCDMNWWQNHSEACAELRP